MKRLLASIWIVALGASSYLFAGEGDLFYHRTAYPTESTFQYGRSRSFDLNHVRVELDIDLTKKSISGEVVNTFSPFRENTKSLHLDATELDIKNVFVDEEKVSFDVDENGITVHFAKAPAIGKNFSVRVLYSGKPRKGIWFIGPDKYYPKYPTQAWTQGETEDTRHWIPLYDYPNDKATSETILTVDRKFQVFSNGALLEVQKKGRKRTYHYKMSVPHVTYLVSFVAGQFDVAKEQYNNIPLGYVVPKGWKKRTKDIFGRTKTMFKFFEEAIGEPYPYEKYDQVVVKDFVVGGMENITATTLNEYVLYKPAQREYIYRRVDALISHELAHQWFGDLITCKSWSHIWLNEGFATYYEKMSIVPMRGPEEFQYALDGDARAVMHHSPDSPTVIKKFVEPGSVFSTAVYDRGSWVLHMLRMRLGDDMFRKAIHEYVDRYREQVVDTSDFRRSMEDSTGADLAEFFDQWVYRGGFLDLKGSWKWDETTNLLIVSLSQTKIKGKGKRYYNVDLDIDIVQSDKSVKRHKVTLNEKSAKFTIPLAKKPKTVRVDPEHNFLRRLKFNRSTKELIAETDAKEPMLVRLDAARDLADNGEPKAIKALGNILRTDAFWGVRQAAADALKKSKTIEAYDELLSGLKDTSPIVRSTVVKSLQHDNRRSTIRRLEKLTSDPNDFVVAHVALALAEQRRQRSFSLVERLADRDSYRDQLPIKALVGIKNSAWEKGLSIALRKARRGQAKRIRPYAIEAIGSIGSYLDDKRDLYDRLLSYTDDPYYRVRRAAYRSLGYLGDHRARPVLRNAMKSDIIGDVRSAAQDALNQLREGKNTAPQLKKLRRDFEELKTKHDELKERIEMLEKLRTASNKDKKENK